MRVVRKALTFDDVLLVPAHSLVLPRDVSLEDPPHPQPSRSTSRCVSAAMDTVTEARLAIAIAQEGGIGIIHKNMLAARAGGRGREGQALRERRGQGSDHHPADDVGARGARAARSSTASRACRSSRASASSASSPTATCASRRTSTSRSRNIMTPRATGSSRCPKAPTSSSAKALMHKHRLERVLVVNERRGAARPHHGQGHPQVDRASARVQGRAWAACASARRSASASDTEERVEALVDAGVDVIVVDTAHGHSQGVLDRVQWVKKKFPQVQVIGGNIATARRRARRSSITAPTGSRSASARARSARRASSPASACRRSRRSRTSLEGAGQARRAGDRRRRHPLFGRHRQGARRRRVMR